VNTYAHPFESVKAALATPGFLTIKPSVIWFLFQYLRKFRVRKVGDNLILHSHLPPLNSNAYHRFVSEHLLKDDAGPSHAQIGLTHACPQNCVYCYNKNRTGTAMDTVTIKKLIQDVKRMGVFWLGFTGGEPLLNKDLVEIIESVGDGCVVKLFTTGCTLTEHRAKELKRAGLYSVSVSLDHWTAEVHDRFRAYKGAFQTALKAIGIFQDLGGIDVGVSAVLSTEMIRTGGFEEFLGFLETLQIHEVWLSETKPSLPETWNNPDIISGSEREGLVRLQDRYNRSGRMTVNYLGHFEGAEHFGCCAGHKMIYIDSFGTVNPCVFAPLSFGDIRTRDIEDIVREMASYFPTENRCFVNHNYRLFRSCYRDRSPIGLADTRRLMADVRFAPLARFFRLHYGRKGRQRKFP
jgi:MoaA/NifB/PqqE/SkfB family radical SAM enzyme